MSVPLATPAPAAAPATGAFPALVGGPAARRHRDTPRRSPQVQEFGEVPSHLSQADPDIIAALEQVLFTGASDLHVTANAAPMLRVDGGLRPVSGASVWAADKVRHALDSLLSPLQREIFDKKLELDFAYTISASARFRVNFYQQRGAIGAAFRLISTTIKTLEQLGVPDSVARFATLPRGLVLVTGPTGSGKSTTLAALIDLVNRTRADHIVTVEDPIEFVHGNKRSLVNQREVGADTHSFATALKHVLRQDPDVILVGEMRDLETISVALTAAETGHLVFATLHTQSAAQTIDRIIDVYPPHQQDQIRTQLSATLQGVVSQTLVQKAHGLRPRRRDRGARHHPGHLEPDPRGQELPDHLVDAGRPRARHAHHGSAPGRARRRGPDHARLRVREGARSRDARRVSSSGRAPRPAAGHVRR